MHTIKKKNKKTTKKIEAWGQDWTHDLQVVEMSKTKKILIKSPKSKIETFQNIQVSMNVSKNNLKCLNK